MLSITYYTLSNLDIPIRRSKTAPVESNQQRKLEEYLSWQKDQHQKRCRLERYLKSVKLNDEPEVLKSTPHYLGKNCLNISNIQDLEFYQSKYLC